MRHTCAFLLLLSTAYASPCKLVGKPWLEGRVGRAAPARSVDARRGETLEVFVTARAILNGRTTLLSDDGRRGHTPWSRCGAVAVEWRRVEPHMIHKSLPAPNKDLPVYANAVVFGPRHGEWIGFDKIEYFETPLSTGGTTLAARDARPSDEELEEDRPPSWLGMGVMRLAATVKLDSAQISTAGAEDAPEGMISDRVFRYSFRAGDDFLGWLTSFFNVPYLFGSAGKGARAQAERYLGADCADILVAALRRAGRRDLEYSSVAGLVDALKKGPRAQPGDLLALDYLEFEGLPKAWDHILVFVEDRGPDGKPDGELGPDDLVADSGGSQGLKISTLADSGKVRIAILRAF